MGPFFTIIAVFASCAINVMLLELLIKDDPGCGNMITFFQFLFIAVEGLFFTVKFFTERQHVPMREYVTLVVLFFVVSVTNNYALNFNIAMPLHMIFKSGSLLANMILGIIILKRSYPMSKYFAVVMVTIGIAMCTIASGKAVKAEAEERDASSAVMDFMWWIVGICMLTFALLLSARMGIYQEVMYRTYGKHPKEAMFYLHAMPLVGFLLLYQDIIKHIGIMNNSPLMLLPLLELPVPRMWVALFGSVVTQYFCIGTVFRLTTECTSLTVTLVLTLRKFFSLMFSIYYFKNTFTLMHAVGTILVFVGTFIFSDLRGKIREYFNPPPKQKE